VLSSTGVTDCNRHRGRRRFPVAIALAFYGILGLLGACSKHETFQHANLDASGELRAVTSTGRILQVPQLGGQAGVEQIVLSPNHQALGWLSLYPNAGTTYPIPLALTVLRPDAAKTTIKADLPIWQWAFASNDKQVVLREAPVHGSAPTHYELRDARTGTLVASADVDASPSSKPPAWARTVVAAAEMSKGR